MSASYGKLETDDDDFEELSNEDEVHEFFQWASIDIIVTTTYSLMMRLYHKWAVLNMSPLMWRETPWKYETGIEWFRLFLYYWLCSQVHWAKWWACLEWLFDEETASKLNIVALKWMQFISQCDAYSISFIGAWYSKICALAGVSFLPLNLSTTTSSSSTMWSVCPMRSISSIVPFWTKIRKKHLCESLAAILFLQRNEPYSQTIEWIQVVYLLLKQCPHDQLIMIGDHQRVSKTQLGNYSWNRVDVGRSKRPLFVLLVTICVIHNQVWQSIDPRCLIWLLLSSALRAPCVPPLSRRTSTRRRLLGEREVLCRSNIGHVRNPCTSLDSTTSEFFFPVSKFGSHESFTRFCIDIEFPAYCDVSAIITRTMNHFSYSILYMDLLRLYRALGRPLRCRTKPERMTISKSQVLQLFKDVGVAFHDMVTVATSEKHAEVINSCMSTLESGHPCTHLEAFEMSFHHGKRAISSFHIRVHRLEIQPDFHWWQFSLLWIHTKIRDG